MFCRSIVTRSEINDIKVKKDSWNGEANYKFNGPVVAFVASF